ncbi:TROVE domain-containing protein [Nocardia seriolae]|uniref:TROVE domain-containing protein n=1 Tax=Nocardia seriolae TaxID=37332 RepID=UPI0011921E46|nr:TROVE domain-containing protein [Nocardia seriolae]GEM24496.1 hypothetical protein NS2_27350 [Nocardia seriolae NBRC 15557]
MLGWIHEASLDGLCLIEGHTDVDRHCGAHSDLVREYRLSWEMLPDAALDDAGVWEALLDNGMPQTALMRQLPRLTRLGLLAPLGARTWAIAEQLADRDRLRRARVHPVNVFVAQRTYAKARSVRGESSWEPSRPIVDVLDAAFYAAFEAVEPTGKRHLFALAVSGSVTASVSGMPLSAREASAALALVTTSIESECQIVGFTSGSGYGSRRDTGLTPLSISPRQRLEDAIRAVSDLPFGGTDCALPMLYALERKLHVDVFVVAIDNGDVGGPDASASGAGAVPARGQPAGEAGRDRHDGHELHDRSSGRRGKVRYRRLRFGGTGFAGGLRARALTAGSGRSLPPGGITGWQWPVSLDTVAACPEI